MSDTIYKFAPGYQGCRKQVDTNKYVTDSSDIDWYGRAEPQFFDTKFKRREKYNVGINCGWKISKKNYKY